MKRVWSLMVVLAMVLCILPTTETKVYAASNSDAAIQQRIDELKSNLVGKYFTTTQSTCYNSSCSSCMVNNVITQSWFTNIFGEMPSVTNFARYYYFANDINYTTGGPTLGQYSCAGFASFAEWYIFKNSNSDSVQTELVKVCPVSEVSKYAMIGDMLRIKWWSSSRGGWSYHSGIYLGQNSSNSVYILDSNGGTNRNQVLAHNFTCDSVVITRAKNRSVSGSGISGGGTTVVTPNTHSHSWTTGYDSAHPHSKYRICSGCNTKEYTGGYQNIKSCSSCYPLGNAKLTREFNRTSGKTTFYRNNVSNASSYTLTIYRGSSKYGEYNMSGTSYNITLPQGYSYSASLTAKNSNTGETRQASCSSFRIYNTYSVSYNANGGKNAPAAQTKIQDENLTLSSSKPTREHYVFKGWASNKTATTAQYQAGGKYAKNAAITLYAVWEPEVYTVNFDANGGKGDLESASITYGNSIRMPNNVVSIGYYLKGWANTKNAQTPDYKIGVDYKLTANQTLYAVWSSVAWGLEVAPQFAGGDGTEENPYQISNAAELAHLASIVNSQTAAPEYKYYILTDNINLGYNEWVPIGLFGNENQYFCGSFDGNGFTISDIYMTEAREGNIGLFGYAKDSEIKNLTITGAIENVTYTGVLSAGGLAGYTKNTNIENCDALYLTVSGLSVEINSSYSKAGCMIGRADGGLIANCNANECSMNLKTGNFDAGIIAGLATNLKNCAVTVSEGGLFSTVSTVNGVSFGGLCGYLSKTAETCSVTAPYLTNEIQVSATPNIGGLVGNLAGELKVCSAQFNKGRTKTINGEEYGSSIYASSTGTTYVGGLIGKGANDNAKVTDCKYDGQSVTSISTNSGYGIAGGIAGRMTAKENPTVTVNGGHTVSRAELPKKDGYTATWYTDSEFKNEYDFSQTVTSDMTLYAKWEKGEDTVDIWDGTSKEPAYNASTKTYTVTNGEELAWISDVTNGVITEGTNFPTDKTFSGYTVELANDIYLNDTTNWENWSDTNAPANSWEPIGINKTNCFKGTFNGNNHAVKGIYINLSWANYQGLFGYMGSGTIKNVGVTENYIKCKSYAGGVVGCSEGTVSNCYNTGTVSDDNFVGGVIGNCYGGTVSNCYNTGSISGSDDVGGIVGKIWEITIINCYNTGVVSSIASTVGGIVGNCYGGTVSNCYNTGSVSGSSNVGGITGNNSYSTTSYCYNVGAVSGSSDAGGIAGLNVGSNTSKGIIKYCYATQSTLYNNSNLCSSTCFTITSVSQKTATQMKTLSNLSGFSTSYWAVNSSINNGYPYLKSMEDTYKTYTITAVADMDNTAIKRSFANVDGIIYGESKTRGAYAGGILGEAHGTSAQSKSTVKGVISVANNISAKTAVASGVNANYIADTGYIVGHNSFNYFDFNAAYYNGDVLSNRITNTTGTSRPTSALKIPSFLTNLVGLNAYQSLDKLKEDETAVWVIKNGELPELYYNCLKDISISGDIENGTITANKTQGIDGEVVEITAAPTEGYVLNKAYVNGEEIVGTTFEISGNSEIYATFIQETPEYTVSLKSDENASATLVNADEENIETFSLMSADEPVTTLTAADGEEIAVSAIADEDYTVDAVYVNGEEIVGDNFILTEDTEVTLAVTSLSTETKAITNEPEHIDSYFAVLSGSVEEGEDNVRYISYWKESEPDEVYVTDIEEGGGEYSVLVDGLNAETTYCYQMNDTGAVKTFTTPEEPSEIGDDLDLTLSASYTKTASGYDIDVTTSQPITDGVLVAALYTNQNRFITSKIEAANDNSDYTLSIPTGTTPAYIKVYLWSGTDGMTPLCEPVTAAEYEAPEPNPNPNPTIYNSHSFTLDYFDGCEWSGNNGETLRTIYYFKYPEDRTHSAARIQSNTADAPVKVFYNGEECPYSDLKNRFFGGSNPLIDYNCKLDGTITLIDSDLYSGCEIIRIDIAETAF